MTFEERLKILNLSKNSHAYKYSTICLELLNLNILLKNKYDYSDDDLRFGNTDAIIKEHVFYKHLGKIPV